MPATKEAPVGLEAASTEGSREAQGSSGRRDGRCGMSDQGATAVDTDACAASSVASDQRLRPGSGGPVWAAEASEAARWDGQGKDHNQGEDKNGEGGRLIRRGNDDAKFIDAPTPTLIDEDEFYEDEEMVKLEYERIRRNATAPIGSHSRRTSSFQNDQSHYVCMSANEDEAVRRTPGAQMYRSNYESTNQNQATGADSKQRSERSNSFDRDGMRRTPGASKMHASAIPIAVVSPTKLSQDHHNNTTDPHASSSLANATDSSGLGFGLTLSSPIAPGEKRANERRHPRALVQPKRRSGFPGEPGWRRPF